MPAELVWRKDCHRRQYPSRSFLAGNAYLQVVDAVASLLIFGAVVFLVVTEPLQSCDLPSLALPPSVDDPLPEFVFVPFASELVEAPVPVDESGEPVPDVPPVPPEPVPALEPGDPVPPAAIAEVAMPIARVDTAKIFKNIAFLLGLVFLFKQIRN